MTTTEKGRRAKLRNKLHGYLMGVDVVKKARLRTRLRTMPKQYRIPSLKKNINALIGKINIIEQDLSPESKECCDIALNHLKLAILSLDVWQKTEKRK